MIKPINISILVVDDEEIVRESLSAWFEEDGYTVDKAANAVEALNKLNIRRWDIYFIDIKMPGIDGLELMHRIQEIDKEALIIIITAYASVDTAVQALKNGAYDYVTKPFDPDHLSLLVRNAVRQFELSIENKQLKGQIETLAKAPEMIGVSRHWNEIKESIRIVAPTETTVMIRGESGTGKELVAHSIHTQSPRRFAPMVTVNCGAITDTLLESELFGHEKGAFTGALYRRKGKLELADGGTLFLDEIGTIGPKMQIDLLRAIETREFTRLGGNEIIHSDFRILCATNSDLEESVKVGNFREDLYYRLKVFSILVLPLRQRPEDIPSLALFFLEKYSRTMNKPAMSISAEGLSKLESYYWPGNVRELENTIESALVRAKSHILQPSDFFLSEEPANNRPASLRTMADVEKQHLQDILEYTHWNISRTARILNLDRVTVYKKLEKFGINRPVNNE